MDSSSEVSFFFEEDAFTPEGELSRPVSRSINKIGHALHDLDPVFRSVSRSDKVKGVLRSLRYARPIPMQSMVIFKQPRIGGEVVAHQDATFLHTTPRDTVCGLWMALEDATMENGCLLALPGSHTHGVAKRFVREARETGGGANEAGGDGVGGANEAGGEGVGGANEAGGKGVDATTPDAVASPPTTSPSIGVTFVSDVLTPGAPGPEEWAAQEDAFVPVPVKAGTLVVLHGYNAHKSFPNTSDASRVAYAMHVVEGGNGVVWEPGNWLQRDETKVPLEALYDDQAADESVHPAGKEAASETAAIRAGA